MEQKRRIAYLINGGDKNEENFNCFIGDVYDFYKCS